MKKFSLQEAQQQRREDEEKVWVKPQPCHICGKMLKGAYGHTTLNCGAVWSCSGVCEKAVQQLKGKENGSPHPRAFEASPDEPEAVVPGFVSLEISKGNQRPSSDE